MQKPINISVPVKYSIEPFEDDRFIKCKVLVMHDGLNLNGSVFNMDSIERAKDSIKNIPILAFVKQVDGTGEADFGGHESEVVVNSDGIKYRYLGRPIGVIPADANDYHYEIYDSKTFVAVTGYIYADYANEALDILKDSGEKGQSMEIRVDDGEWDEYGLYNINSYRYTGVTILGDNVTPAMTGAKVQLFSTENDGKFSFSEEYFEMLDELNSSLKKYTIPSGESEVGKVEDEKDLGIVEGAVVQPEAGIVDGQGTIENAEGAEGFEQGETSGEAGVVEGEEGSVEPQPEEPTTEEPQPEADFSAKLKEKDDTIFSLNTALSNLQARFDALEAEIVDLREYKRANEASITKGEKEAILNDFSVALTEDEMKPVKDEIDNISVNEIKVKLNEIFTNKNLEVLKSKKFTTSQKNDGIVMDMAKKENSKSKYAV